MSEPAARPDLEALLNAARCTCGADYCRNAANELAAHIRALEGEVKECREALKPFADYTSQYAKEAAHDYRLLGGRSSITLGDFRRAEVAMRAQKHEKEP